MRLGCACYALTYNVFIQLIPSVTLAPLLSTKAYPGQALLHPSHSQSQGIDTASTKIVPVKEKGDNCNH